MYGNFGNPYANPYANMQNRLNTLEQQYQQYSKPQTVLNGRIVTGIEEARASQIALDGTPSYFPSPAENKIYVKSLDMNGLPIFLVYKLDTPINCERTEQNVSISQFVSRIEALEQKVKEMESHEPNATSTNA